MLSTLEKEVNELKKNIIETEKLVNTGKLIMEE